MSDPSKYLIVFDMDGVIMDVSASYRETIRRTARQFFEGAAGYEDLPDPLFSLEDLAAVKQSGGLNNDWETTYSVISLLMTQVHTVPPAETQDTWQLRRQTMERCDLSQLVKFLNSHADPLQKLLLESRPGQHPIVSSFSAGDVGSGNIIKQIFQEIYLGKNLFETTYPLRAAIHMGSGLIDREKLLIASDLLQTLSGRHILAIATGRPESEANYALRRFDLLDCFRMVLTLDDCLAEENRRKTEYGERISLSKPHPFMLDTIAAAWRETAVRNFYVGDMPDDMEAARRAQAGFVGVGVISPSPDRDRLKHKLIQSGAAFVIEDISDLDKALYAADV